MGWLGAWHRRSVDEQLHLPPSPSPADQPQAAPLTERELEVLGRLAERLSNKEIAKQLFLSPLTVKRHTLNIYQKLGVHGRREAVKKATALGILAHH
jgi:ATP/maltotriose-dependent transcriptional regulator MalT